MELELPESDDPNTQRFQQRLRAFHALTDVEREELATALFKRKPQERRDSGFKLYQAAYPQGAKEMARAGAFHSYGEFPDAARDLLAWWEFCLREGRHDQHYGLVFDNLYHLYNLLQLEALMPSGREGVFEELQVVKQCLNDGDKAGALKAVDDLLELFRGGSSPPQLET